MDKKELRRTLIARRDAIAPEERARIAGRFLARLVAMPQYRDAKTVLATMSIGSEWNTRPFIDRVVADGKTLVLPRITPPPKHLEIHAVPDLASDLVAGVWDIPEPDPARCPRVSLSDVDLALVPALAIDREHYRLGYGAGFFDGLLAGRGARPYCVTALPAQFHVERLPRESHDVPLDAAISESP
ncbi:MAG TPA: 5-formyltetrahydrofolate cyclo-ligase [Usitatibacter sp.]